MANLDVSDVLLDPDFMETGIICKRTEVIVGNNGRSQETITNTSFLVLLLQTTVSKWTVEQMAH